MTIAIFPRDLAFTLAICVFCLLFVCLFVACLIAVLFLRTFQVNPVSRYSALNLSDISKKIYVWPSVAI